jgi:hypothetical protein
MDFLQNHIEALIFCSPTATKVVDLKACLSEMFNADVPEADIEGAIQRIEEKFADDSFSFQLNKAAGGYHAKAAVEKKIVDICHGDSFDHCLQTTSFKNRS